MSWKYREPLRSDYDTDEEYEDALALYDAALADYAERCKERYREARRHREES